MKTIKVNPYDKESVEKAVKDLEVYKKDMEAKARKLIERLSAIGCNIASAKFYRADYDGDGFVGVRVDETGNGLKIVASGQAVCFIEFGAGVARGGGYPEDRKPEGIVGLGEYGKGHGATGQPWYYAHGKKSDGNPPAMAMLTARDTMVEEVTQIAREVFGV